MRTPRYVENRKTMLHPSPARFMPAEAEVEDHAFVDGTEHRRTMGRIWRRHRQGDLIRPAYPGKQTAGDA